MKRSKTVTTYTAAVTFDMLLMIFKTTTSQETISNIVNNTDLDDDDSIKTPRSPLRITQQLARHMLRDMGIQDYELATKLAEAYLAG